MPRWKSNIPARIRKMARDHEKRQNEQQRLLKVEQRAQGIAFHNVRRMRKYLDPYGIKIHSYNPQTGEIQFSKDGRLCGMILTNVPNYETAKRLADFLAKGFH